MTGRTMHLLDAMTAAPEHHEVLLENDKVRVLDTCLGPGLQTRWSDRPAHHRNWSEVV